ncbi:MAG: penicillin-binding protein activator LpoB [Candidatus Omnitrophota bacterium]|nr:MAG: penicillin-binding protein activator LpoB [Candidatus Omnitrophota bacterium]
MQKKLILVGGLIAVTALFANGCAGRSVKRLDVEKVVDISGRWNDTDARLVSEEMIKDCLMRPWLDKFNEKNNGKPTVIVGTIINRSHEHINSALFIKDLEMSLINSNQVKFVASKEEREELRQERTAQHEGFTKQDTVKSDGFESGADFMLKGSINSSKDEIKGKYVIMYQVNLELINLQNNEKVWIGQKEIKKYVKKGIFRL